MTVRRMHLFRASLLYREPKAAAKQMSMILAAHVLQNFVELRGVNRILLQLLLISHGFATSLSFPLSFLFGSPLWPYPFGNIEGMGDDQEVDLSETAVV
jgi:hypothetical protein